MDTETNDKKNDITPPKVASRVSAGNSWLSDAEATSPEKTRIVLPSASERRHPVRNFFLWLIVLGVLGFGGYKLYPKYADKVNPQIDKLLTKIGYGNLVSVGNKAADDQAAAGSDNASSSQDWMSSGSADSLERLSSSTEAAVAPAASASSTPAATITPSVSQPAKPTGPALTVNDNSLGYLNVRSQPASSGDVITKVHPGEAYSYIDKKYDWYLIILPSGQSGWVSGSYVTVTK